MAISKELKRKLVEQYVSHLQDSQGVILADYRGLRVAEMERLRGSLRGHEVVFQVVKNRLFRLALEQMNLQVPDEWLQGPTAVAFCRSEVPPAAKALNDFGKETERLVLKGGLLGSSALGAAEVQRLANLPPREILLAQLLGTINGPATRTAGVVASGIRQVLNVLQAYVDKLEGDSPAPQVA